MNLNKILRWVALGGIFLVPFVSLVVANNLFFPFITGKAFVFRILVMIATGAWLILALRDEDYRPKNSWLIKALVAFLIIIGLADIFSVNPFKSFWSNFERMEGWVGIFHLFLYFLVAGTMLNDWKYWKRFFQTSITVSVIMAGYGIFQLAGVLVINQGGTRLDGTFGNATYLAVYMLFHIFLTFFILLRERFSKTGQWIYGVIIALQLFILYHTATRGAVLGLIGGILIAAILIALFDKERLFLKKGAKITLVTVLILIIGFIAVRNTNFVQKSAALSRLASISLNEAAPRFMVWQMGWQGFKERPILGWGQKLVFDKIIVNRIVAPLIVIVAVFGLYFFNTKPYLTSRALIDALREKTVDQKFVLFEKALAYNSLGNAEIREQLSQTALAVGAAQEAPVEWKQKYFDFARTELLTQLAVPKID